MKRKAIWTFCAALCILGAAACVKEGEPSPNEHGYADKAELESMLEGKWLADLDGDPEQDVVLMQLDFGCGASGRQTVCVSTLGGGDHSYDLASEDVTWSVVENYEGYASAGLSGDAVCLVAENEVFYIVKQIAADSLKLQYSYADSTSTMAFGRVSKDIDTSTLVKPALEYNSVGDLEGGGERGKYQAWMADVPDDRKICDMCIPGSHDSGTNGVDNVMRFAACCQGMNIQSQWDYGCRAFDLRVRVDGKKLSLFHNFVPCNLEFWYALDRIKNRLKENPTETAIVIVKPEGNDMAKGWLASKILSFLVRNIVGLNLSFDEENVVSGQMKALLALNESGLEFIAPRADLTLGQARGKIIVVFRYDYLENLSGGEFDSIGYASKWGGKGSITTHPDGQPSSFDFYVQDVFGQDDGESDSDWFARKQKAFTSAWDISAQDESDCWYFNAASGYNAESYSIPNYVLTANSLYRSFASTIELFPGRGIVLQDFLGVQTMKRLTVTETTAIVLEVIPLSFQPFVSARSIADGLYSIAISLTSCKYDVDGLKLTEAVIRKNFQ